MATIKMKFKHELLLLVVVLTFSACVDKNAGNITEISYFTPEYSLPLGSSDVIADDIVNEYRNDLTQITDTSGIDTIDIFDYDSVFYKNPGFLDVVYEKSFDITTIIEKLNNVKSFMIRTNCINHIPGKLSVQIYFLDYSLNKVDSLYKPDLLVIKAAKTDADGQVSVPFELWKHDTYLSEEEIQNLSNIGYIWLYVRLEPENYWNNNIIYYSSQKAWIQMGIRTKLEVPLNEL